MISTIMPDPATPFGARVARRLREERVIWLTTVGSDGTPQPNPVWFLWDGETILVYTQPGTKRLRHIEHHPRVTLHFDTNGHGGDIVVISGTARISPDAPPASAVPAYVEKYAASIPAIGHTVESMASAYSVAVRITPTRVRGF